MIIEEFRQKLLLLIKHEWYTIVWFIMKEEKSIQPWE